MSRLAVPSALIASGCALPATLGAKFPGSFDSNTSTANASQSATPTPQPIAKVKAEGPTSPIAAKYAGKIVFSSKPIDRGPTSDAGFKASFKLDQPIYGRPFLQDSIYNLWADKDLQWARNSAGLDACEFKVRVEGGQEWTTLFTLKPAERMVKEDTTFLFGKQGESITEGEVGELFVERLLPRLKVGTTHVEVELVISSYISTGQGSKTAGDPIQSMTAATGAFDVAATKAQLTAFMKAHAPQMRKSRHPQHRQLVKLYREALERHLPDEQLLKASSVSPQWDIEYHQINGRPTRRLVRTDLIMKNTKTNQCALWEIIFFQRYAGAKKYNPDMDLILGQDRPYPCAAAK